ncbi:MULTISPECIES: RNA 2'-phosphotransferase [unclassified Acinetobacter]|uniref:RNA 2'-phosphotransferase n=1 Tax=unclassified Acinetobacter TaxID=196816 RepID=UPI0035B8A90D
MSEHHKQISKYLSYILRYQPESIGLQLDNHGWAVIDDIIQKTTDMVLSKDLIAEIVKSSDKQRFIISEDQTRIRANQGHSIPVDLNLIPQIPPDTLYHGTAQQNVDAIMQQGIKSNQRQYVHLSDCQETAWKVGSRHGKPAVLKIDTKAMSFRWASILFIS